MFLPRKELVQGRVVDIIFIFDVFIYFVVRLLHLASLDLQVKPQTFGESSWIVIAFWYLHWILPSRSEYSGWFNIFHLFFGCSLQCWKFNNLQTTKLFLFYSEIFFSLNYREILQPKIIFNFIRRLTKLMSFYHWTQPFITHQFERNFFNFHVLSINFQRIVAFIKQHSFCNTASDIS